QEHRYDLILSGHAHGGQWRIPGLLDQGLFAPDQGLFPEFTCGQREKNGTVQIVSRGLAKTLRMALIPRIFNRPELSVIDIIPQ
ncbi:MAG: phosphoesterase, partial [Oscillospiraceae bacterium]|nr:phosphoesterase [Oscillospiraceae bacterium]